MKGNSNNRKEKMSPETKLLFDRLTECAMKLLENGDYNVYHEKQEVFKREAEGYERLAWAKGQGTSVSATNGEGKDFYSQETNSGVPSVVPNVTVASATAEMTTGDGGDEAFNIFAEDDGDTTIAPSADGTSLPLSHGSNTNGLSSEIPTTDSTVGALQNDEFDKSSGYYYTTVAVWAITMTRPQDCIVMPHRDNGTRITRTRAVTMNFKRLQHKLWCNEKDTLRLYNGVYM